MAQNLLRAWRAYDIQEVKKHLLNIGDARGNCENCKELGLEYKTVKKCPNCGTDFFYAIAHGASKDKEGRFKLVKRVYDLREDLIFLDYDDVKALLKRAEIQDFFKD